MKTSLLITSLFLSASVLAAQQAGGPPPPPPPGPNNPPGPSNPPILNPQSQQNPQNPGSPQQMMLRQNQMQQQQQQQQQQQAGGNIFQGSQSPQPGMQTTQGNQNINSPFGGGSMQGNQNMNSPFGSGSMQGGAISQLLTGTQIASTTLLQSPSPQLNRFQTTSQFSQNANSTKNDKSSQQQNSGLMFLSPSVFK